MVVIQLKSRAGEPEVFITTNRKGTTAGTNHPTGAEAGGWTVLGELEGPADEPLTGFVTHLPAPNRHESPPDSLTSLPSSTRFYRRRLPGHPLPLDTVWTEGLVQHKNAEALPDFLVSGWLRLFGRRSSNGSSGGGVNDCSLHQKPEPPLEKDTLPLLSRKNQQAEAPGSPPPLLGRDRVMVHYGPARTFTGSGPSLGQKKQGTRRTDKK